ncbi:hypothetical protein RDV89_07120 [Nocardioides zeae]|uniref:Flp pilus-assembly TadG-like N-terminal domain-containing protein n=1 Tax=Nocardioides imazamoxiresistens TaxID=3231893 RepID=A0ABU3PUD5_9ACTN|nr:hypothetical protein [Nocardioides zeae]MDT9592832.1 hypothetical protein [Nocardioides zeae]
MSNPLPPPPPPGGRGVPPGVPQPGAPYHPAPRSNRGLLVGIVVGLVVLLLAGGTWGLVAAFSDDGPQDVRSTAEQAVEAAQALDVDAGARLMCTAPTSEERDDLEDAIEEAQEVAGTDDPEVAYEITEVTEDADGGGTATVEALGDQAELEGAALTVRLVVVDDGDRHCIDEIEVLAADVPQP